MVHNLADFSLEYPGRHRAPLRGAGVAAPPRPSAEPRRLHRAALLIPVLLARPARRLANRRERTVTRKTRLKDVALAVRRSPAGDGRRQGASIITPPTTCSTPTRPTAEVGLKGGDPRNGSPTPTVRSSSTPTTRARTTPPRARSAGSAAATRRCSSTGSRRRGRATRAPTCRRGRAYAKTTDELRRLGGADPDLLAAVARLQRGEVARPADDRGVAAPAGEGAAHPGGRRAVGGTRPARHRPAAARPGRRAGKRLSAAGDRPRPSRPGPQGPRGGRPGPRRRR